MGIQINGQTDRISAVDGTMTFPGTVTYEDVSRVNVVGVVTATGLDVADTIVHNGDSDTKIRFPAADTFTVETAGSERFRIDSSGNTLIYGVLRKDNVSSSLSISGGNGADSSANIVLHGAGGSPANVTQFRTGSTERLRIASDGNVGIGTDNPGELLHLESGWTKQILKSTNLNTASSVIFDVDNVNTADFLLGQLAGRWNGNDVAYINFEAGADTVNKDDGVITFLTSASGSTPTEKLRITAAGNVGVGIDNPTNTIDVDGNISVTSSRATSSSNTTGLTSLIAAQDLAETGNAFNLTGGPLTIRAGFVNKTNNNGYGSTRTFVGGDLTLAAGAGESDDSSATKINGSILFGHQSGRSGFAEKVRIDSSGNLRIGQFTTTDPAANDVRGVAIQGTGVLSACNTGARAIEIGRTEADSVSREVLRWFRNGSLVQTITTTATTVNYPTGSDYRLKENVVNMTGAIDRVKNLSPKQFNFIAEPGVQKDGFIAHELATVVPQAVVGEKDQVDENGNPVWQGVDHSFMVPLLTGALQEALAEIESLKARVTALEP